MQIPPAPWACVLLCLAGVGCSAPAPSPQPNPGADCFANTSQRAAWIEATGEQAGLPVELCGRWLEVSERQAHELRLERDGTYRYGLEGVFDRPEPPGENDGAQAGACRAQEGWLVFNYQPVVYGTLQPGAVRTVYRQPFKLEGNRLELGVAEYLAEPFGGAKPPGSFIRVDEQ